VRVWKPGDPEAGITWTQETSFVLANWLSQQEAGEFLWSIAVIEGSDGQVESVMGEAPPPRQFTLESNVLPTLVPTATPEPVQISDMLEVADGFSVQIYAHIDEALTAISAIEFTDKGDLLALALDGRLFRLGDDDGDGVADRQEQLLFNDDPDGIRLVWAAGMALYEDRIYVSEEGRVGYLVDRDDDGVFDDLEVIIDNLPGLRYQFHSNNGIAFDADGKLYIAIGSTTDHGPLQEEYEASILSANADGSDLEVFATGFRNTFDLAIDPDGRVFAGDNGPDRLDADMPFYPPEELNYIREGRDYGFPDVYGNGIMLRPHAGDVEPPVVQLPTSSVTSGIVYYTSDHFPNRYRDGLFVVQYGGFNRQGRKVIFVRLSPTEDGGYSGDVDTLMQFDPDYRPIDVTVGPDGALYVVEWNNGYILRVTYEGE